jgi:hypothetical protein
MQNPARSTLNFEGVSRLMILDPEAEKPADSGKRFGGVSRLHRRESRDPCPANGRPISLDADSVHHDLL